MITKLRVFISAFAARAKRYLRELLWMHLFWGTLCHLRGHHLDLVQIGEFSGRKGFRGVPMFQCRRCFAVHVREHDAKRIGGRAA